MWNIVMLLVSWFHVILIIMWDMNPIVHYTESHIFIFSMAIILVLLRTRYFYQLIKHISVSFLGYILLNNLINYYFNQNISIKA